MNQKFKTKLDMFEIKRDHKRPYSIPYCTGYSKALDDAFESFKERVNFYKEYKGENGLIKLDKKEPEVIKEWEKFAREHSLKLFWKEADVPEYNRWLFNYCFRDVISNE